MSELSLRDHLIRLLQQRDLDLQTTVAAADLLSADAAFNLRVAERKDGDDGVDFLELVEFYEGLVDRVIEGLAAGESWPRTKLRALLVEANAELVRKRESL